MLHVPVRQQFSMDCMHVNTDLAHLASHADVPKESLYRKLYQTVILI